MRKFQLDKLIRDKVYQRMLTLGQHVDSYVLKDDSEFTCAIKAKVGEETAELEQSSEDDINEELIDLLELIDTLAAVRGTPFETLREQQRAKREKVGGFVGRIFVRTVTLGDNDPWVEYYVQDPERFPEIEIK